MLADVMLAFGGGDAKGTAIEFGIEVEQRGGECDEAAYEQGKEDEAKDNPLIGTIVAYLAHEEGVVVGLLVLGTVFRDHC